MHVPDFHARQRWGILHLRDRKILEELGILESISAASTAIFEHWHFSVSGEVTGYVGRDLISLYKQR